MEDLAPGFRFYPTEEELVSFYLHNKLEGRRQDIDRAIPVVDIYGYNPWDLPQFSGELCRGDPEQWFFFIPRQERTATGGRPNRLTTEGYWKATGSPGFVYSSNNRIIGGKRTMVFYRGRAPNGNKTQWKMNEYRAAIEAPSSTIAPPNLRQEISLCRVYIRSKSQRSFDRRPGPPALLVNSTPASQAATRESRRENETTLCHHQNHPIAAEGTNSKGSSLSADDENPSEVMETGNWNLVDDMEGLWDWYSLKEF